jgi:hypothetical protein
MIHNVLKIAWITVLVIIVLIDVIAMIISLRDDE